MLNPDNQKAFVSERMTSVGSYAMLPESLIAKPVLERIRSQADTIERIRGVIYRINNWATSADQINQVDSYSDDKPQSSKDVMSFQELIHQYESNILAMQSLVTLLDGKQNDIVQTLSSLNQIAKEYKGKDFYSDHKHICMFFSVINNSLREVELTNCGDFVFRDIERLVNSVDLTELKSQIFKDNQKNNTYFQSFSEYIENRYPQGSLHEKPFETRFFTAIHFMRQYPYVNDIIKASYLQLSSEIVIKEKTVSEVTSDLIENLDILPMKKAYQHFDSISQKRINDLSEFVMALKNSIAKAMIPRAGEVVKDNSKIQRSRAMLCDKESTGLNSYGVICEVLKGCQCFFNGTLDLEQSLKKITGPFQLFHQMEEDGLKELVSAALDPSSIGKKVIELKSAEKEAMQEVFTLQRTFYKYFFIHPEIIKKQKVFAKRDESLAVAARSLGIEKSFFHEPIDTMYCFCQVLKNFLDELTDQHEQLLSKTIKAVNSEEAEKRVVDRSTSAEESVTLDSLTKQEKREAKKRANAIRSLSNVVCDEIVAIAIIDTNPALIEQLNNNSKSITKYKRILMNMVRSGNLKEMDYDILAFPDKLAEVCK